MLHASYTVCQLFLAMTGPLPFSHLGCQHCSASSSSPLVLLYRVGKHTLAQSGELQVVGSGSQGCPRLEVQRVQPDF